MYNPSKVADAIPRVSRRSDRHPARYSFQSPSMPTRDDALPRWSPSGSRRTALTRCIPVSVAPGSSASFAATGLGTRSVGLRADMDCLAMNEERACLTRRRIRGYALPVATTVTPPWGWAPAIWRRRAISPAPVYSVFQPAEEGMAGAKAMIDDGLFSRFPISAFYALHNAPWVPYGKMAVRNGP